LICVVDLAGWLIDVHEIRIGVVGAFVRDFGSWRGDVGAFRGLRVFWLLVEVAHGCCLGFG
jgi:hypothetical protein